MMHIVYEWRRFYSSVEIKEGKKYNLMQACSAVNE